MIQLTLSNTGKRFNRDWIFRHLDYTFTSPGKYAITGSNGSGKSTLLQIIAGALTFNEGKIEVKLQDRVLEDEQLYRHQSMAAPYLELVEEMTAMEFLEFHGQFKPLIATAEAILQSVHLHHARDKQVRYYSSGMKQRLKLAQAFFCASPLLLLDEPTTNLDAPGIALYHQLIHDLTRDKLVIISSNDPQEYSFCGEVLDITRFK